jgi:hypothetical protein
VKKSAHLIFLLAIAVCAFAIIIKTPHVIGTASSRNVVMALLAMVGPMLVLYWAAWFSRIAWFGTLSLAIEILLTMIVLYSAMTNATVVFFLFAIYAQIWSGVCVVSVIAVRAMNRRKG